MEPIKKIEIITDSIEIDKIIAILEKEKVSGYTIFRDVVGKGERGIRNGDFFTEVMNNTCIMAACPADKLEKIVARLKPILKKFGGICLVSDCYWIVH
jgi:nitrogen regulatory protein PII